MLGTCSPERKGKGSALRRLETGRRKLYLAIYRIVVTQGLSMPAHLKQTGAALIGLLKAMYESCMPFGVIVASKWHTNVKGPHFGLAL